MKLSIKAVHELESGHVKQVRERELLYSMHTLPFFKNAPFHEIERERAECKLSLHV